MNLIALHGFLGQSQDFEPLKKILNPHWSLIPDLFGKDQNLLRSGFDEFVDQLSLRIDEEVPATAPLQLVGYSLGGRLALHLALKYPKRFDRVILLSTHPGVFDFEERALRSVWEQSWVRRIKETPWETWTREWMNQDLFLKDPPRSLKESDFSKEALIRAFECFSSTMSTYSQKDLSDLKRPFVWVTGEKDLKFCQLMKQVQKIRPHRDQHLVVEGASHRLLAKKDLAWLSDLF